MWSKVKAVLRKLKAMTHEKLQNALQQTLGAMTKFDIKKLVHT
jgi:hypothetical protein